MSAHVPGGAHSADADEAPDAGALGAALDRMQTIHETGVDPWAERTYSVTYAGTCSGCGVHVAATPGGIPEEFRPDAGTIRLGQSYDEMVCICGEQVRVVVVGLNIEPYRTTLDLEDDDE